MLYWKKKELIDLDKTWKDIFNKPEGMRLFTNITLYKNDQERYDSLVKELMKMASCSESEALIMIDGYNQWSNDLQQRTKMRMEQNRPHCPTCHSANVHKISGLSKAGSVAVWGIFSQKVKKQFHCDNCGYEW